MKKKGSFRLTILTVLACILCLAALFSARLVPYDPYAADSASILAPPGGAHLLGTDDLGRDIFSRLLAGLGPSLGSAFAVVSVSAVLGTVLGVLGGYFSGPLDVAVRWLVTTFQAFPSFLLAVVIAGFAGSGWRNACFALVAVYWASSARLSRSLVLAAKEQTYLSGALLAGCSRAQLLVRHVLPNILPQILVNSVGQIGSVIISMAGLSFLGLGAQRPTAEWGVLLSEAQRLLRRAPQLLLYTSAALVLLVLLFNLLGDSLRDFFDSRIAQQIKD